MFRVTLQRILQYRDTVGDVSIKENGAGKLKAHFGCIVLFINTARDQADGFGDMDFGDAELLHVEVRHAIIVLAHRIAGLQLNGFLHVFHAFFRLVKDVKVEEAEFLMRLEAIGIDAERIEIVGGGLIRFLIAEKFVPCTAPGEIVQELRSDLADGIWRAVYELWDVGCAVWGGKVLQNDRRSAFAIHVNVREPELGIGTIGLGAEDEPLPIGRPTVPGVHLISVTAHEARLATLGRHDVEAAIAP